MSWFFLSLPDDSLLPPLPFLPQSKSLERRQEEEEHNTAYAASCLSCQGRELSHG